MTHAADLVLTGGAVYTVDAARRWAEAIAVRAGRIASVGTAREVAGLVGPRTRVLELEGRMVLPGFQDAHLHPSTGGLAQLRCKLHDVSDRRSYLELIGRYAQERAELEWIVGGGWSMDAFPGGNPRREDLDAIVPARPVFLTSRDVHSAWVNSRALELAGITRATPDPPDGRIERDEAGESIGTLHEGAMGIVRRLLPVTTQAEWEAGIEAAQAHLHSLGITACQDAKVTTESLTAYRALADRGKLTMRVEGNLSWERDRGEEQLADLVEQRARGSLGRLRIRGAKIFQDGVMENFTAAMLEPYLGTGTRGISMHEAEELRRIVTLLDAEGFQVHVHAIGDRAVRESLDAFEAAQQANGRRDARHHLAHVQVVHHDDVPRFRELGVVANVSPYWAVKSGYIEDLTLPFVSEETARQIYPFGSLVRAGAPLAFGSDWTVSTANPLLEIEVAVTRVSPQDRSAQPFLPEERLDLPTAIAAFTIGSAYVNHLGAETGSIEPGKLADLAVLDRNVFDPGAGPIGNARVVLTLVEGEAVYADTDLTH